MLQFRSKSVPKAQISPFHPFRSSKCKRAKLGVALKTWTPQGHQGHQGVPSKAPKYNVQTTCPPSSCGDCKSRLLPSSKWGNREGFCGECV